MSEKIRVLFLAANPKDIHPLQLDKEMREIDEQIQRGSHRDLFELTSQWALRPDDLQTALLRFKPHIVHFSGHGSKQEEIILENDDGTSAPVRKQALTNLFGILNHDIKVIVLNACFSRPQAEAMGEVIDYTIGTSQAIKDRAAIKFAGAFYRALAFDRSVREAFGLALNQLDISEIEGAEIPVLYVRDKTDDTSPLTSLLALGRPLASSEPRKDPLTRLEAATVSVMDDAAIDEDRCAVRRAISDKKMVLTMAAGERAEDGYIVSRHRDRLELAMSAAATARLEEQLYAQPPGLPPVRPSGVFLGREGDLGKIKALIGAGADLPRTSELTVVRGWPGVGKTTLVSVIGYDRDVAHTFPDGVLWTYLDQTPDPFKLLASWEKALVGTEEILRLTSSTDAVTKMARLLRDRRMLLIVDDAWHEEDAKPFLLAANGSKCSVLVTTRLSAVADLLSPNPERIYQLPVLDQEPALQLLRHLAPAVVDRHETICRALVRDLECLPLSLHVAGRLLRREADLGFDVVALIAEIREGTRIIRETAPSGTSEPGKAQTVTALLTKSTSRLDAQTLDCFAFLGVFAPKPATFDAAAMKAVWSVDDPRPIIIKLVDLGLLEPVANGRFQMHALLVEHAKSFLQDEQ